MKEKEEIHFTDQILTAISIFQAKDIQEVFNTDDESSWSLAF